MQKNVHLRGSQLKCKPHRIFNNGYHKIFAKLELVRLIVSVIISSKKKALQARVKPMTFKVYITTSRLSREKMSCGAFINDVKRMGMGLHYV